MEDWISERRESMVVLAGSSADRLAAPGTASSLEKIDKAYGDFNVLEVVDLSGKVQASRRAPESAWAPGTTFPA